MGEVVEAGYGERQAISLHYNVINGQAHEQVSTPVMEAVRATATYSVPQHLPAVPVPADAEIKVSATENPEL